MNSALAPSRLPSAVLIAAANSSSDGPHRAGSSPITRFTRQPCARLLSEPTTRSRAPVSLVLDVG